MDDYHGVAQYRLFGYDDMDDIGQEGIVQFSECVVRRSQLAQSGGRIGIRQHRRDRQLVVGHRQFALHADDGTVVGHHQGGT